MRESETHRHGTVVEGRQRDASEVWLAGAGNRSVAEGAAFAGG